MVSMRGSGTTWALLALAVLVVKAADAAPPLPSPDEPAAKKASSTEGPHWIHADGSWGCTALSTASGCTTKPDPAEVKAVKAALDLRSKANSLTDHIASQTAHIATLEAERASALKQAERAEADARKFKPQGAKKTELSGDAGTPQADILLQEFAGVNGGSASRKLMGACHGSNCGGATTNAHLTVVNYQKCSVLYNVLGGNLVGKKVAKFNGQDEKSTTATCESGCSKPGYHYCDIDANGNQRECKMTHSFNSASGQSCSFQVHAKYTCSSAGDLSVNFYQINWHPDVHDDCKAYSTVGL